MPCKPVILIFVVLAALGVPVFSVAQNTNAPPRNVDDILAVLDQYKPDPSIAQKRRQIADAPPSMTEPRALAQFYIARAGAASAIGRSQQQRSDLQLAYDNAPAGSAEQNRSLQSLAIAEAASGRLTRAVSLFEEILRTAPAVNVGTRISTNERIAKLYRDLGDIQAARTAVSRAEDVFNERTRFPNNAFFEQERVALIERARAEQYEVEGKFPLAEVSRRAALRAREMDIPINKERLTRKLYTITQGQVLNERDYHALELARNLKQQGKLTESEALVRAALTRTLNRMSRYSTGTAQALGDLAEILRLQGRYHESEKLLEAVIDILLNGGALPQSLLVVRARRLLASILVDQEKWPQAVNEFDLIISATNSDEELAQRVAVTSVDWGLALIKIGNAQKSVQMLEKLSSTTSSQLGNMSDDAAMARGVFAMALVATGERNRARREFQQAIRVLLSQPRGDGDIDAGGLPRATRVRHILESYIELLSGNQQKPGSETPGDISEAFLIADVARGSAVQHALSATAARAAIADPRLAELARTEQDAGTRLGVLTSLLSRLLAAPSDQQLPNVITGIRQEIETLRAKRTKQKVELERQFPDYANLIDPKPVTLEQARAALRPGEALISVYVGASKTYVWAVPQQGAPAFAVVARTDKDLTATVTQLRTALDIGNAAIARFPRFDTAAAHRLFNDLLKPVEVGWKDANSLIIVPHRALGQLPFSLLVTAPAEPGADAARFDGYRAVPWFLRKAAITQLPSVNALTTLRALPAATAGRREFIGFGDPYFSKQQAAQAAQERVQVAELTAHLRNLRIGGVVMPMAGEAPDPAEGTLRSPNVANSATLAQLSRLPETADEIRDIAQVLKADMSRDVFLGVSANEKNVKTTNLADRKIVAFATHGLVPGDLNGLDQPALALTAPDIAGIDGDGLLTMEEILNLKLNADWVVLSACNTGSADGAGSEAVSGLGRAFFYAGARSLLVSNWPVETNSARLLTTDVFKRSVEDPALSRAEALRQTMLWLMDNAGQKDASGKTEFTYAHPMFWAPFALIGDGGR